MNKKNNQKKYIFALALVIAVLFSGCRTTTNGNLMAVEDDNLMEINADFENEIDVDPLVEYALNNIDFQFVSDTGYYMDYNTIATNNYSNMDMIEDIKALGKLIEEQDFSELREKILDIPDYNNLMREVKINYIVPTLMHENKYLDALRILYKKEAIESQEDRFLFDIIYLMRYMYVNNDLEYAIEVVDQLKIEYPKENVSYMWFAISPRQYDVLNTEGIVYPPEEDSERNKLWKYLVKNYPNDLHIDYALYFLGDYEELINKYPNSELIEKAMYARANDLLRIVINVIYNEEKLDRIDLALTKNYYEEYLENYPDSDFSYRASWDIVVLCNAMYYNYGEDAHYFDFINAIREMEFNTYNYNRYKIISRILSAAKSYYINHDDLISLSDSAKEFLEDEKVSQSSKYYIWSGLANNAFYKGELELAKEYFNYINRRDMDKFDLYRLITLAEMETVLGRTDADSLFEKAEILRRNGEYFASVYIYNQLVKMNISDEALSKAYMLRASSSKKNRVYDEMLESYEYIVNHLNHTEFADDALAEIGVHYLLSEKAYDHSREIFREVIKKYPQTNAVNNAYNWIAWSYLQEEDYENALIAYEELLDKFPTNRFGKNAIPNIKKIKKILNVED